MTGIMSMQDPHWLAIEKYMYSLELNMRLCIHNNSFTVATPLLMTSVGKHNKTSDCCRQQNIVLSLEFATRSGLERSLMITKICNPTSVFRSFSTFGLNFGNVLIMIVVGLFLRVSVMVPFAAFSAALGTAQCFPAKKKTDTGGQGGGMLEEGPALVEDPTADGLEEGGGANICGTGILIVVKLLGAPARVDPAIG